VVKETASEVIPEVILEVARENIAMVEETIFLAFKTEAEMIESDPCNK